MVLVFKMLLNVFPLLTTDLLVPCILLSQKPDLMESQAIHYDQDVQVQIFYWCSLKSWYTLFENIALRKYGLALFLFVFLREVGSSRPRTLVHFSSLLFFFKRASEYPLFYSFGHMSIFFSIAPYSLSGKWISWEKYHNNKLSMILWWMRNP